MKQVLTALILLVCLTATSRAEQIGVKHVCELIKPAEIIARVKILAVQDTGATEGYTKIAYAQVDDAILGVSVGSIFLLENDAANVKCPNVRYEVGEDVLVFAKRIPGGNYQTVYVVAGKFLITNETVNKAPFRKDQSYDSVLAEIKRSMKEIEKPQNSL